MKRNISLTDILSNLTLNDNNKKAKISIVKNTIIAHEDVFDIGKIHLEKELYSRNEVIMILNTREATLYESFIKLLKTIACNFSISNVLTIPKWVK